MNYLIAYDLADPGQDYSGLENKLKEMEAMKLLRTTWVVSADAPAVTIADELKNRLDDNDQLVVFELGDDASTYGLGRHKEIALKVFLV